MRFLTRSQVAPTFRGRRVAIVGSGPGCLDNPPGYVDAHDVVVRVNNYKLQDHAGARTDVHYSFYGTSVRKTRPELRRDGVKLCLCKCPNAKFIESEWHTRNNKEIGVDFRYVYKLRRDWWWCDTYVPETAEFTYKFEILDRHIPTTGFAAILDVLSWHPSELYLTGFDFFQSGLHNVDEPWRWKNPDDPIKHEPERELDWLRNNAGAYPIIVDQRLSDALC